MPKDLVIVESPTKVKSISRYLGSGYVVKSSVGHVRDLPASGGGKGARSPGTRSRGSKAGDKAARAHAALVRRMGVDPEHGWRANYEVIPGKEKVVKELRAAAAGAERVFLATDLDREGEAIAWHLTQVIGGAAGRYRRVTFQEITARAIREAFASPGELNRDRIDAQQARRFLDRVVGYMVSPLLWKKVARGLSAGRVQSVALRLVVEREREIKAFVPEEFWEIHADLTVPAGADLRAQVVKADGEDFRPGDRETTERALAELRTADYRVAASEVKPTASKPYPPLVTSSLQQAAAARLGFGVKKTMTLAQRLYEAGRITYMRTDSTNLSTEAVASCREFIAAAYGAEYVPEKPRRYASRAASQEAHEAIRPSDVRVTPGDLTGSDRDASRLYDLIWRQFVACQMPPAAYDSAVIEIDAGRYRLRARGRVMRFDGWLKVLPPVKRNGEEDVELPRLAVDDRLALVELDPSQHFTKPPPRYGEASLVRELTKRGIGRPSTYAAIISTIQERGYVRLAKKRLYAEKIGEVVADRLVRNFDDFMDYDFTAHLEEELDEIAGGRRDWREVLDRFYARFTAELRAAERDMLPNDPTPTGIRCPACGRPMVVRTGSTGVFLGCSGYDLPKTERCTETLDLEPGDEAVEVGNGEMEEGSEADSHALRARRRCPLCGTAMDSYLVDEHHRLHVCGRNPECPGTEVEEGTFKIKGYEGPTLVCDKCGSEMRLRAGRYGKFFACTDKACKNTRKLLRNGQPAPPKADPVPMPELPCEKSDGHFVLRDGAAGLFLASSKYPRSRETRNPRVEDLVRHREELDPKFAYLCEAPTVDPDGNPTVIRFSRKAGRQYVGSDADGKPTRWTLFYEGGAWVEKAPPKGKPKKRKATKKKAAARAKKKGSTKAKRGKRPGG